MVNTRVKISTVFNNQAFDYCYTHYEECPENCPHFFIISTIHVVTMVLQLLLYIIKIRTI